MRFETDDVYVNVEYEGQSRSAPAFVGLRSKGDGFAFLVQSIARLQDASPKETASVERDLHRLAALTQKYGGPPLCGDRAFFLALAYDQMAHDKRKYTDAKQTGTSARERIATA